MGGEPQYAQKFRQEWLKLAIFKDWLSECSGDASKAFCKLCRCDLKAKLHDLQVHMKTRKHTLAAAPSSSGKHLKQATLDIPNKTYTEAIAEAKLAMFVCNHCAIMSIDHLVPLCKSTFSEAKSASQMRMHRTKCSGIIQCVLFPHFQKDLLKSVQSGFAKYSLFLDESTDISVQQLLGIGINYFDGTEIVSTFLALAELKACDAHSIASAVKDTVNAHKLPLNQLIGIATDNANTMIGINNGLFQILKQDIPNLILIKCVCHSLQLAVSHAVTESLPRVLEFMISETYNWFSRSSLRRNNYKQVYQTLNDGKDPKKIVQSCNTRWLSIECAILSILEQYVELKAHFQIVRTPEKCYNAELLYNMYKDETNLLYLLFLKPVLTNIQQVNKAFESNNADPLKLLADLVVLIREIAKILVIPTCKVDPIKEDITPFVDTLNSYLGYNFEVTAKNLKETNKISVEQENTIIQSK